MFQSDISGQSSIDIAINKTSMFSVKAFAESILKLKDVGIRNCFEKAIIQLILKGMEVNDICQSNVLYPQIW